MTQSIKGLLFDKDGTLFDFNATWGTWAAHFFKTLTGDERQAYELGQHIGFDTKTLTFAPDSIIIAGTPEDIANGIAKHLPDRTITELVAIMNETAQSAPQAEVTPLRPFLTELAKSYKLGVATNDAEEPARHHLQSANIIDLLDFVAGYDSGFGGKPTPGMQHAFCEAHGLHAHEVAMVGDATHDLIAGRAAGMRTVGVLTGLAETSDLTAYADVVLPSIEYLPGWLAEQI